MKNTFRILGYYGLALIFLYPIVAHILMYQLGYFKEELPHGRYWVYIQIFLSGPILLIVGLMLYFKHGEKIINKVFGVLIALIGGWWLFNIIRDVVLEAA